MNGRQSLISLLLVILCVGILVLFTDIELLLVRWVNCGPIRHESERSTNSQVCQR